MEAIVDIIAIEQLAARYNHALDGGDGDGVAATFVADGSLEPAGREPIRGHEALRALARGGDGRGRHHISNMVIDVDGDTATMRAYLQFVRDREIHTSGMYADTLRRVDGEWRFVVRRFTPDSRD